MRSADEHLDAVRSARDALHTSRRAARQALRESILNATADGITYAVIGRSLGISRERVRQLAGSRGPHPTDCTTAQFPLSAPLDAETTKALQDAHRAVEDAHNAVETALSKRAEAILAASAAGYTYAAIADTMGVAHPAIYSMANGYLARHRKRAAEGLDKAEVQHRLDHTLALAHASGISAGRAAALAAVSPGYVSAHVRQYTETHGLPAPVSEAVARAALSAARADWLAVKVAHKRAASTRGTKS